MLDEILARYQSLPEDQQRAVSAMAQQATQGLKWIPNPGPQTAAYFSKADVLLYGGAGGGGKGLLSDEKVITPYGYRRIGDLKEGERVLAADGCMTRVIGVYPQPEQQVYRVKFDDGAEIITDGPHRWNYSVSNKGRWRKSGLEWKVGTTEQLADQIKGGRKILIPLCKPLKINKSYRHDMRVIDPYVLGLLLGDGYIAQAGKPGSKITFTTTDQSLIDSMPGEWRKDGIDYRVVGRYRTTLQEQLPRLGLSGCKSKTKHVPEPYLFGSIADRGAILQGLMDTDGTVSRDGKAYFTSVSQRLAENVRWLALSLGGRATITSRTPAYRDSQNKLLAGQKAYTTYIRMPDNRMLFRLERKRSLAGLYNGGGKTLKRRIKSITPAGTAETICIAIDHPSSLYVAGDDLIVTHNTDLGLGLAFNEHRRSLVMRRRYVDLSGAVDRAVEIHGSRNGLNSSPPPKIRVSEDCLIEFGAAQHVGDEESWQGRPRDLLYVDEAAQFAEIQIRFLMGWVRSAHEGQRCRVVLGSNPPLSDEGLWMIRMFAPWLDPQHPDYPAQPGELRWYVTDGGKDFEVPGPGEYQIIDGEPVGADDALTALSRTFIPSKLKDNPFLSQDKQYKAQQDAMPPHLRDAIRDGNFAATRQDHELQLIPSAWIKAAQDRWRPTPPENIPMCAIGVDIAQGGNDNTVLQPRYDWWFAEATKIPGKNTPLGKDVAGEVMKVRRDGATVILDMGGGYGGATYEQLSQNIEQKYLIKYKGASKSTGRAKHSHMPFKNTRAEAYWRFYEALDPSQPGGSQIALGPSQTLYSDLCAIRWHKEPEDQHVITLEPKEDLVARLGRSTDEGDAVVQAWYKGTKGSNIEGGWRSKHSHPKVVSGRGSYTGRR